LAQFVKKLGSVFKRKWTVGYIQVNRFASDVSWGLGEIQKNPKNILWTMALALSGKALLLVIFFLSFEAFHVPFSVGTLVAGFSMGYLFTLVSPTPAGVGVVEGVLTVVLGSLNVAISAATLVTLAYRGLTFWLPLIYGFVAFRVIKKNSDTNGL